MLTSRASALIAAFAAVLAASGCASAPGAAPRDAWGAARGADTGRASEDRLSSPAMVQAAIRAAEAAAAAGDHASAADLLRRAYDARPTAEVAAVLGREIRLSGATRDAVAFLQEADRRTPRSRPLLVELGRAALAGGFLPEAEQALAQAVALGPAFDALMVRGALLARKGDTAGAETTFRQAATLAPTLRDRNSAEANAALALADGGNLPSAIAQLEVIAARADVSPRVVANLALLHGANGDSARFSANASRAGLPADDVQRAARWLDSGAEAEPQTRQRRAR